MENIDKYIGIVEVGESVITIVKRDKLLIAGTTCNTGLIEQHQQEIDDTFSLDENLQEFIVNIEEQEELERQQIEKGQ